jgi:anaerobic selenocysteine-containing dehydrogenase
MDWTTNKSRRSSFPPLGRRSFFKIGAAAYTALMYGCGSSETSRTFLTKKEREWAPSVCTLCPSYCAIRAYSGAGKIVSIAGDPDDPNTGGKLCPIGLSMLNLHYNPDRLTNAFKKNPDGKMAPAKAEEILLLIADLMRGGRTLHLYGRITPYASYLSKFINVEYHRNPLSEGMSAYPGFLNTNGLPPVLDFENARIALLFDANILEHGYPYVGYVRRIVEARLRGLRLVTLSPFLTNTATAGDWIPLRSCEAVFLAPLAIARQALNDTSLHIINIPQEIAKILCSLDETLIKNTLGISAETIRNITRRFFNEPGPAVSDYSDPAVLLLNIMKGNLNRRGGLLHPGNMHYPGQPTMGGDAHFSDIALLLRDRKNVVFLHQSNPAFNCSSEIRRILRSSDRATIVCIDSFMSETAELSDFVLPLASPLETLTIEHPLALGKTFIAAAPPVVNPRSSSRSFNDWLADLTITLTTSGSITPLTPQQYATVVVSGNSSGRLASDQSVYLKDSDSMSLQARMAEIISVLDGRIAFFSKPQTLMGDEYFLAPFEESIQNSLSAPSKWLNEISYSPKAYVHPQRAGRLGIRNGDRIILTGRNGGSAEGIALLFEGVHPDAIGIPMHHGHTGYGRVGRGEAFADSEDPDMSRIFWGNNRGVNPADIGGRIVTIGKKRG